MRASTVESFFTLGNQSLTAEERRDLGRHWVWMMAAGLFYIFLGILAFTLPVASSVGLMIALAALLLAGGAVHLINAFRLRHEHGSAARFFQATLSIITGALMFRYPEAGMLGVAFALSFYFFMSAGAQWVVFSASHPQKGWNWGLASSLLSFFLGVFILLTFPFSALWVPGTLLGIDLVFGGSAMLGLAFYCHNIEKETHPIHPQRA